MAKQLKRKRFRVTRKDGALLAEKNRFSRWGPYVNHIGLIVFLLAVLLRTLPGWSIDNYVTVPEGETVQVPDTKLFHQEREIHDRLLHGRRAAEGTERDGEGEALRDAGRPVHLYSGLRRSRSGPKLDGSEAA